MRIAIVGSRNLQFNEEYWYDKICENIPLNCTEIVSGAAEGIDTLARRYAKEHGLLFKEFPPDYGRYGREAPLRRNIEIVEYAHFVVAFWDGKSRGTAYTISACIERGIPFKIVNI